MTELLLAYTWYAMGTSIVQWPATSSEWAWLGFGLLGNFCFFTRFLVQWIYSERCKESRIPTIFWWQSIAGTLILLLYFIHKGDPVGMLGYSINIIPYVRNLMLIHRKKNCPPVDVPLEK